MNEISAVGAGDTKNLFSGGSAIMGKDDFLKILITQLQNQDPLSPQKAEDFASQLAEFSQLEQMQNMNANLLDSIELDLLLNQAINNTMATTLIGRGVRAVGNTINHVQGESTAIHYNLAGAAKKVSIVIKDADGNIVNTVEVSGQLAGNQRYEWDGKDSSGDDVAEGIYTISVSAEDVEGNAVGTQTFVTGVIDGIRYENGSAFLLIDNMTVSLADVIEIGFGESDEDSDNGARTVRIRN